ncbi:MAG: protocatechuate 3,4-dioxygenase subunit alpha, partial [Microbacterium sp.]|nr:protocatechuate 3,4-dioxygenase subunit alpha [Microbacterium sp.]
MPDKTLSPTPGQTVGPFFAYGTIYPKMHEVAHPHSPGAVVLGGTVYDGAGAPIPDSLVEIWGP